MENWKDIPGWKGVYQISDHGRVKSFRWNKEKILKIQSDRLGYQFIMLHVSAGVRDRRLIHRIVAQAFLSNPENKPEVNHKDLNKSNNHISNLEWNTRSENIRHSIENGHHYIPKGVEQPKAKINDEIARDIKLELRNGKMPLEISKTLNVPYCIVKDIKRGKTWRHVEV
jgi:hypothetical protein